jgi:hypothetical protein
MSNNDELSAQQATFLKGLCRHMVSLTGELLHDPGNGGLIIPEFVSYAGLLISVNDVWFLVTAGHILEFLDEGMETKKRVFSRCELVHYYRLGATNEHGLTFNYADAKKAYRNDDGLGVDFGFVQIDPIYRRLLEGNNVIAIPQENWEKHARLDYEFFGILGLPEEKLDRQKRITVTGETIGGGMQPVLMAADETDAQPREKPIPQLPWLALKIRDQDEIKSMKGMSGGPVFGFLRRPENKLVYTIAAVQSWWDRERRIAFATRLPPLMAEFYDAIAKIAQLDQKKPKEQG